MLAPQYVPCDTVKVVVAGKDDAAGDGEGDGGDTGDEVVVCVDGELLVAAEIKQPGGGIVRACDKSIARGEELHSVDVTVVACKCMSAFARSNIPHLCGCVAGSGYEDVFLGIQRQAHHVALVALECSHLAITFYIPQNTGLIAGGGDDLFVVDEPAAGEIAGVGVQFPLYANRIIFAMQVIN